jgi:hypothetical protein
MSTLGFFYTCYTEKKAVEYSVSELRKNYPDSPIYLTSDGGLDFSYLEKNYSNLYTSLEEDTISATIGITGDQITGNFRETKNQNAIKKCAWSVLDRLERAIEFCKTDYILMLDPDALVRGKLTIPEGVKLLGSRVNSGLPQGFKNVLSSIDGAKVINCWGATPGIFEVNTFQKSLSMLKSNPYIIDKLSMEYYAICAHDLLIPILFALVGEEETFNPDIIECNRDPNWKSKSNPLVHQFREFYE